MMIGLKAVCGVAVQVDDWEGWAEAVETKGADYVISGSSVSPP